MNTPNIYTGPSTLSRSDAPTDFSARLLPLSDGRPGLRGTMPVEVREPSPRPSDGRGIKGEGQSLSDAQLSTPSNSQPVLDFISSDETLDRYSEIISAAGWKLDSYHRNPVFQNAHQYGDVIFTLGKALITEIRSGPSREAPRGLSTLNSQPSPYLFQRIQFATDVNPMARIAHGLYRGKFLNAVSVGFIPRRWENGDGTEHQVGRGVLTAPHPLPSDGRGIKGEGFRRRYLEQELLEVSVVAIPANPN